MEQLTLISVISKSFFSFLRFIVMEATLLHQNFFKTNIAKLVFFSWPDFNKVKVSTIPEKYVLA